MLLCLGHLPFLLTQPLAIVSLGRHAVGTEPVDVAKTADDGAILTDLLLAFAELSRTTVLREIFAVGSEVIAASSD